VLSPSFREESIVRYAHSQLAKCRDALALEEPLEIRLGHDDASGQRVRKSISITMRTPGHDEELALGFLYTEGIVRDMSQIAELKACGPISKAGSQNVMRVELSEGSEVDLKRLERHFYTSSSCGVCGKTSIEALKTQSAFDAGLSASEGLFLSAHVICELPQLLRRHQAVFDSTGGLHASALFSLSGELVSLYEDVGRHNALDKVIGNALRKGSLPLHNLALLVSGRASFELVQKASMAGIRVFLAIGAPSSLALELAREQDMTLVGFVRDQRMNIYHGEQRITHEDLPPKDLSWWSASNHVVD
jgi:FdhD protein